MPEVLLGLLPILRFYLLLSGGIVSDMDGRCAYSVLVVFAVTVWVASASSGEVTIDQKPVVVERKSFDPAHRPGRKMPAP